MTRRKQVRSRVFILVTILIVGLSFIGLYVYQKHSNKILDKNQTTTTQPPASKKNPIAHVYSLPSRLVIPKLSIDASILPVGVTPSGEMDSPKTDQDTGWYSLGVRPGNVGSAVIAGHLGLKNDAVFGKLHLLIPGDIISVTDDQGATVSFAVKETRKYERESDTTKIFNSQSGSHLNLITCNGNWESSQATYDKRLVVFAEKI